MALADVLKRLQSRSATPVATQFATPATLGKNVGLQRKPASMLARTLATPATPTFIAAHSDAANDGMTEAQEERAAIMHFDGGIEPRLADLLSQHGGYSGIDWAGLALIDATTSPLWIVQRPDGVLTVLATVEPVSKPLSYRQAWPARFTSPEPVEAVSAPAAEAAAQIVQKARQSCWGCRHLGHHQRPTCALGHPAAWRQRLTRTYPARADSLGCSDQDGSDA